MRCPRYDNLTVDGAGHPNGNPVFEKAIDTLCGVSRTVKLSAKKAGAGMESTPCLRLKGYGGVKAAVFQSVCTGLKSAGPL